MVMYTGLDRVAEATGFPVHKAPLWRSRGNGQMKGCKTIVIHHTAGANRGADYNSYNTVLYGRPGIRGLLSQYGVGRKTGTIYLFGAGLAWHAGKVAYTAHSNAYAIGIEIENNGVGEPYGSKTYNSAVALAGELVMEFGLTINNIKGHKEVAIPKGRKTDPSFNMSTFRRDVQKYINKKTSPFKPASPKPVVKPTLPKENTVSINLTPQQLEDLIENASERGAEKALSAKTVSWRNTTTGEIVKYSLADAVGYLSVHWNRELERDEAEASERKSEDDTDLDVSATGPSDSAPDAAPTSTA